MSNKHEKLCDECLAEMFRRVGEEFPNKELTDQDAWYAKRAWTCAEEDDFREWMETKLKKEAKFTAKQATFETSMFLLNWGWKTSDPESR